MVVETSTQTLGTNIYISYSWFCYLILQPLVAVTNSNKKW